MTTFKPRSFRFSPIAVDILRRQAMDKGVRQSAILEIALREYDDRNPVSKARLEMMERIARREEEPEVPRMRTTRKAKKAGKTAKKTKDELKTGGAEAPREEIQQDPETGGVLPSETDAEPKEDESEVIIEPPEAITEPPVVIEPESGPSPEPAPEPAPEPVIEAEVFICGRPPRRVSGRPNG